MLAASGFALRPRWTVGERPLVEARFDLLKYRTRLFYSRFSHHSSWQSVERWVTAFATFHNTLL